MPDNMEEREAKHLNCLFLVPNLVCAGAEAQLVDMINGLDHQRFTKHLISLGQNVDLAERLDGEHVHHVNLPRRYKIDFAVIKTIARVIDDQEIDVIHCTLLFSFLFACLTRFFSKRKPPIVAAIHTTKFRSQKYELRTRFLYCPLLKIFAKDIIFVCQSQLKHWTRKYPTLAGRGQVIYNGIHLDHFDPDEWGEAAEALRQQLGIPVDKPVISCIAGFRPEKGHLRLLEAVATMTHRPYLILAGEGQTLADVQRYAQAMDLNFHVRFLGKVKDVRPLLAMSDMTVLASSAESFSMAMLESMCMEVPMLSTDVGGMCEAIFPFETGFLVKSESVTELAEGLTVALSDQKRLKLIGNAARQLVLERFGKKSMVDQTGAVLINAVAETPE